MIKRIVSTASVLCIASGAFAADVCYERSFSKEHLAKSPHQTVIKLDLHLYVNQGKVVFSLDALVRGDKKSMVTEGFCEQKSDYSLLCTNDYDNQFFVRRNGTDAVMLYIREPEGSGSIIFDVYGDEQDPFRTRKILHAGIDDTYFKLKGYQCINY